MSMTKEMKISEWMISNLSCGAEGELRHNSL